MTAAIARPTLPASAHATPVPAPAEVEFAAAVAGVRQCGWMLLGFWAVASVAANGVHAWLKQPEGAALPPLAAAAFGVLAPLALLGVTELIARLLRLAQVTRGSGAVYAALGLALLGAVGLAGAAFRLSFEALSEFGQMCGVPTGLAWLVPCIIDGAILVADVAVVTASTAARLTGTLVPTPTVPAPVVLAKFAAARMPTAASAVASQPTALALTPAPMPAAAPVKAAYAAESVPAVKDSAPARTEVRTARPSLTVPPIEPAPVSQSAHAHTPRVTPPANVRTDLRDQPPAERPRIRMVTPRLSALRNH